MAPLAGPERLVPAARSIARTAPLAGPEAEGRPGREGIRDGAGTEGVGSEGNSGGVRIGGVGNSGGVGTVRETAAG